MRVISRLFALSLLISPIAVAGAQQTVVTGQITDTASIPVPGARILIVELGRRTSTLPDGTYRLGSIPFGSYTLSISRLGLVPQTKRIQASGPTTTVNAAMSPAGIDLAPVQVTASTGATRAQDSPQPTSVMEGAELRVSQATALGDVLESIPGVRTLSMTTGIGKPVIRGMTHYRVVTLDNGQRTETQAWGHDHSPNVETATAERIEVIKGPSSVLYGSDALGGVINVIAQPLPDAIDLQSFVRGKVSGSYNHNIRGMDGTLTAEGASGGFGARLGLTSRSSGDMRTPVGRLDNTNNRALAPEIAVGYRGGRGNISARYNSRIERIEIYDDPAKVPDYTGFQNIESHRASIDATAALGRALIQANAGFEQNFRREFASANATTADLGLFVRNWTGFAHLNHAPVGVFSGTLGISGMLSNFENRGSKTLIPDSETRTAAIYLFEQAEVGRWKTMFGARLDGRTLSTGGNTSIGVPAQTRSFNAITGSAGALYKVTEPVALVVNVATGFRAPSAPDLFANGFHEGTRAFERGNPDLEVERSLNVDAGVRVTSHDMTGEVTAFVNRVSDYIYLRPFGTSGSAFDSLQVVQGNARLVGLEGRLAWRPVSLVTLQMSGDYVRGQNTTADVPLTFIPPLRLIYGAKLHGESLRGAVQPYVSANFETNWKQTRTDPRDFAPPGYTVASLGAGAGRVLPRGLMTVDLSVKNVFDAHYRSFMSRYKEYALAPGRVVTLRVTTPL